MNYRHAFHAGNFADLLKHGVLLQLLAALMEDPTPLTLIDTHAGAGVYDLGGEMARKTGEAQRGIAVLMADKAAPRAFWRLMEAVGRVNGGGPLRLYPGSPLLIAKALRPGDSYVACEIRSDDYATLKQALPRGRGALALKEDGWNAAVNRTPRPPARALVLIDPPFERSDDYARITKTLMAVRKTHPRAALAIWLPIKDLATYDAFLGELEDAAGGSSLMLAEVRLRPLSDPMKMNGCALAVVNPPAGLAREARAIAEWIVGALGEAGAEARIT